MIIDSSKINMNSSRKYFSTESSSNQLSTWGLLSPKAIPGDNQVASSKKSRNRGVYGFTDNGSSFQNELMDHFRTNASKTGELQKTTSIRDHLHNMNQLRLQTLNYLLSILSGRQTRMVNLADMTNNISAQSNALTSNTRTGGVVESYYMYAEQEATTFSTTGTVKTSDGREFNFNVELSMSRTFMYEYSESMQFGEPQFTDPLVINLDCAAADVKDQKFLFDLDSDGHEEAISMLGPGSGFLALDKDKNGKIDNGNELFGARTGNGFRELAEYDSDGNGWIDEADPIWNDLMVWTMDKMGNPTLTALGKTGVGAIYLGSAEGDFSLNNSWNQTQAVVRASGMFLYEDGGIGTIQQLDMAL